MKKFLLFALLIITNFSIAQQITLDTSLVYPDEGTIEEFWYWSGGFPVLGEGFSPNAEVTVFATNPEGVDWRDFTGTSDGQGNFSIQISAKKIRSIFGEHTVTATDGVNTVTATLTVIANEREVLDTSTDIGELTLSDFNTKGLTIYSSGLEPNAEVKVIIFSPNESGSEIEPTVPKFADANGNFEMTINSFTPSYPWGDSMPQVSGIWRVNVHDFTSSNTNYGQVEFRVLPDNPSTNNYCTVVQIPNATGTNGVYPITSFEIENVNLHESSVTSEVYSEDFTNVIFDLEANQTYTVILKGKNSSAFAADTYTLFFDWNQNGILDEENEIIHEGYLFNSTGEDGKSTEFEITVPENAINGDTRLRVLKVNSATAYSMFWPVGACGFYINSGQVEDYTINISNGITLPDCEISCPDDILVQAAPDEDSAIVNYEIGLNCDPLIGNCEVVYPSNNFETGIGNSQFNLIANDFDIPEGTNGYITQIIPNFIGYSYGADVYIYEDANGIPGDEITSFSNVQYASQTEIGQSASGTVYEVVMDLPQPVELSQGKYWVVLNAQGPGISWESTSIVSTETTYRTDDNGQTWDEISGYDGVFKVVYECQIDPSNDAELVLKEGMPSGSSFPIGETVVIHELIYKDGSVLDSCSFTVTVEETLGINDLVTTDFSIFPNPTKELVNVWGNSNIDKISIYSISGQLVIEKNVNSNKEQVNISSLSIGAYIIKVQSKKQTQTYKLLKM